MTGRGVPFHSSMAAVSTEKMMAAKGVVGSCSSKGRRDHELLGVVLSSEQQRRWPEKQAVKPALSEKAASCRKTAGTPVLPNLFPPVMKAHR